jgi:L-serine/L-threonine ammonia-lyase
VLHLQTPLVLHTGLSTPQRRIWLKLDNLQPCGSFKLRGIGLLCSQAKAAGKQRVVCASGGNAGFATAFAAHALGLPADVVVPSTTPETTRQRIASLGATVTVFGDVWDEANEHALELAASGNAEYIPAFDHPVIWEGHSTMIDEIVAVLPEMDAIVASVGGGGLLAGVLTGLLRHGRTDCRVIACETTGAASFRAALDAGHPVLIDRIDSIAKSLGARQVASWPVDAIKQFPHDSLVLSDADAIAGVTRFADDHRQLVEPACGVSLAVAYLDHPAIADAHDVVIVVCGGVSIDARTVAQWAAGG